ncbi:MAG: histidine triad nucleotide-binding protein [Polyangiaceae bacterium]
MCLFCKIASREIPAKIVLDNEFAVAFEDTNPQAPKHFLVIPKKHLNGIHEAKLEDALTLGEVLMTAREVAENAGLGESGYRLVVNNGTHAGQSVMHLHVHVLGGRQMAWPPG